MKYLGRIIILTISLLISQHVYATDFSKDLSIDPASVQALNEVLVGKTVRIYTTVSSNSTEDLFGVVKFYDENKKQFIGADQPISILAGKTDDVFVDWTGDSVGNHEISVRVVPWHSSGDDPSNNKVTKTIYADNDSDSDGVGNRSDIDDDNDGYNDNNDAFPYDPTEWVDTDGDGIGDNADEDDDNDSVVDLEDIFPLDSSESLDFDADGIGNNADAFPNDPNEYTDSDNDGVGDNSDSDNKNHGPIPQIETNSLNVSVGEIVTFNALKSRDPDGEIASYEWDLGNDVKRTGVVVDYVFKEIGTKKVVLKVTDNKGESREQFILIEVGYKWQSIALIFVTMLLIVLIIGHKLIFPDVKSMTTDKKKSKVSQGKKAKTPKKRVIATKRKPKKPLPKKKK